MRSVLVTGAGGFLGQHIVRHFHAAGWHVVGVGCTPPARSTLGACAAFFRWTLPDRRFEHLLGDLLPAVCVHAAGPASVAGSFDNPARDHANGPALVFDVLQQIRRSSPHTKLIHLSSAAVYGQPSVLPIAEDQTPAPLSPYGMHKLESERLCREFAEQHGLRTASVRIFSAYGPGLRRQVLWDICTKVARSDDVILQGTGEETRDFIHAADVAGAVERVADCAPLAGEVYNLAAGKATLIADVAARIQQILAPMSRLHHDGVLPRGTPSCWQADISKLTALGFQPRVSFGQGLTDYVAWYRRESGHDAQNKNRPRPSRKLRLGRRHRVLQESR